MPRVPVKNPEFFYRSTESGDVHIVDLELENAWKIDGLAAELWRSIDGVRDWESILDEHRDSCELDDFEAEAETLLAQLTEAQLLLLK